MDVCHECCLGNMGCPHQRVGRDIPGVLWSPVVPRNTAQGGWAQARRGAVPRTRVATMAPHACLVTFLLFMNCFYLHNLRGIYVLLAILQRKQ